MTLARRNLLPLAALLLAGTSLASAHATDLVIESWRNDDLVDLAGQDHPGLRGQASGHQGQVPADGTQGIRCGAARQAGRRHGRRPDHLPAVRRRPAAVPERQAGIADRHARAAELPRLRARRLEHGRRLGHLLHADGLGDPRLHVQQGHLQGAGPRGADHRGRVLRRARQDQGERQLHPAWRWAPSTSGKRRPWATPTSARPTGRARRAARRWSRARPSSPIPPMSSRSR